MLVLPELPEVVEVVFLLRQASSKLFILLLSLLVLVILETSLPLASLHVQVRVLVQELNTNTAPMVKIMGVFMFLFFIGYLSFN